MPLSLYEAFVPTAKQLLTGMRGLADKGEAFAKESGIDASELIDARLAENMWNLPWHVRACWMHSAYAIKSFPSGEFTPDFTDVPGDFDAMRAMIDDALEQLGTVTEADLDAIADKPIGFILGGKRLMEMTGQNFLLSFNQPNFNFHATTFYDILRMMGVPLSKMDFMGPVRVIGN